MHVSAESAVVAERAGEYGKMSHCDEAELIHCQLLCKDAHIDALLL